MLLMRTSPCFSTFWVGTIITHTNVRSKSFHIIEIPANLNVKLTKKGDRDEAVQHLRAALDSAPEMDSYTSLIEQLGLDEKDF